LGEWQVWVWRVWRWGSVLGEGERGGGGGEGSCLHAAA